MVDVANFKNKFLRIMDCLNEIIIHIKFTITN